jgi:hypothetical protein
MRSGNTVINARYTSDKEVQGTGTEAQRFPKIDYLNEFHRFLRSDCYQLVTLPSAERNALRAMI